MSQERDPESIGLDSKQPLDLVQEADSHSVEYQEYLALQNEFSGTRLNQLNHKIDRHLLPPLLIIYMLTYVDRSNIGNAKLFGAQQDLHMTSTDWNVGLSLLFVTFAFGGPLSNLVAKKWPSKFILPFLLAGCGSTILVAGCLSNRAGWFSLRLVLGIFESGVPGISAYILSTWYAPEQYASRASWFYVGATLSGAVSGLLAYGIGQLDGHWGYRGWRWIYVLEGFASIVIAGVLCFFMVDDPSRKAKWTTSDEHRFIVLRNKYGYGSDKSGNSSEFDLKAFMSIWKSPHFIVPGISAFSFAAGIYAFAFTLPTIIKDMGFTAAAAQGLSAPPYIGATFAVLFCGWYSDKYKHRVLMVVGPAATAVVGLAMCWGSAGKKNLIPLSYIGCMIAAIGFYPLTPTHNALFALNNAGQTKRSSALGSMLFFTQMGGILGSNIYLSWESPTYPTGFGVSAGLLVVGSVCLMCGYWVYVGRVNRRRAAIPEQEIREKYTAEELEAMGDLSPLYVYSR